MKDIKEKPVVDHPTPTIRSSIQNSSTILEHKGKRYAISSFDVKDAAVVKFVGNYTKKLFTTQILREKSCVLAINGGFYDTNYSPIGLYIEDNISLSRWEENELLNGVFFVDKEMSGGIGRNVSDFDLVFALQSGPILVENRSPVFLRIFDDEYARRSVVLIDDIGILRFLSVYDPLSTYDGPFLSDLPNIIIEYGKKEGIGIDTALNLDGGSASFFKNKDTTLSELAPVGGVICVQ